MGPGAVLQLDVLVRHPVWAVVYQIPIACLAVYVALMTQVEDRPSGAQLWRVLGAVALGATVAVQLVLWLVPGLIGLLVAVVGMYVIVMVAFDKLLHIHVEHAHGVTASVCGGTWLLWLLAGGVVRVIEAL